MSGERAQVAAWQTVLDAVIAPWHAVTEDLLPTTKPDQYLLLSLTRTLGAPIYMSGGRAMRAWYLSLRFYGGAIAEAQWMQEKVATLEDRLNLIPGATALRWESGLAPEMDNGVAYGLAVYRYAAPV